MTVNQVVDQFRQVIHADVAAQVSISSSHIDRGTIDQIVDQCGQVVHADVAIAVHVTAQGGGLSAEVAWIAGATVDVGIFYTSVVGIVGRALAAHQTRAAIEHI